MCIDWQGITGSDGEPFSLDDNVPYLLGYQILHVDTGRILPGTNRNEVYTKAAAIKKMNRMAAMYTVMHTQLEIWDYILNPVYEGEVENYKFIEDIDDHLFE